MLGQAGRNKSLEHCCKPQCVDSQGSVCPSLCIHNAYPEVTRRTALGMQTALCKLLFYCQLAGLSLFACVGSFCLQPGRAGSFQHRSQHKIQLSIDLLSFCSASLQVMQPSCKSNHELNGMPTHQARAYRDEVSETDRSVASPSGTTSCTSCCFAAANSGTYGVRLLCC
jgi:hypothetical protein